MDQLGELKLGDCWVQRTESTDAQRISADRAEAMLQILGELNLNMRSNIERQGARVNLGRQIQVMRRVLGTERRKEQVQRVMRQGMPEENGIMQQQRQKDLSNRVDQGTASQMSRRHKQMMRRLWDGEQQREEAEQELRNFTSQVHGHKQEQEEHDDVGSEKARYTT